MSSDFEVDFDTLCKGKQVCDQPLNLTKYIDKDFAIPGCVTNTTRITWQIFCTESVPELNNKRGLGLVVVCFGFFMCAVYLVFVSYLSKTTTMDYKVWDVDTVTAADFTVEFPI